MTCTTQRIVAGKKPLLPRGPARVRWAAFRDGRRDAAFCSTPRDARGHRFPVGWVDRHHGDTLWCAATHGVQPCTFHRRRCDAKRAAEAAYARLLVERANPQGPS